MNFTKLVWNSSQHKLLATQLKLLTTQLELLTTQFELLVNNCKTIAEFEPR